MGMWTHTWKYQHTRGNVGENIPQPSCLGPAGCGIHPAPPQPSGTPRMGWVVLVLSLALVFGMCGVHDVHGDTGHVGCMRHMGLMGCMG